MDPTEALAELFVQLGASWVLWLLGGLSVLSLAVSVERWLSYRRAVGDVQALAEGLYARLEAGDLAAAEAWLAAAGTVPSGVAAAGLRLASLGPAAAAQAMDSRIALERERLERRLSFLGTLGNNAPFIGLFGTVIGVIQAFAALGEHQATGAAGQVASAAVMSAIAEALVATAVGIGVALPAVAAYNLLTGRVEAVLGGAEVLSKLVLAFFSAEPRPPGPGGHAAWTPPSSPRPGGDADFRPGGDAAWTPHPVGDPTRPPGPPGPGEDAAADPPKPPGPGTDPGRRPAPDPNPEAPHGRS